MLDLRVPDPPTLVITPRLIGFLGTSKLPARTKPEVLAVPPCMEYTILPPMVDVDIADA